MKRLVLIFILAGCASTQQQASECPEGSGNVNGRCERLLDATAEISNENFEKVAPPTATKLLKAFNVMGSKIVPTLVKTEAAVGGIILKFDDACKWTQNANSASVFCRDRDLLLVLNTSPYYYSRSPKTEELSDLHLACSYSNHSYDDWSKMLVLNKCRLVKIKN